MKSKKISVFILIGINVFAIGYGIIISSYTANTLFTSDYYQIDIQPIYGFTQNITYINLKPGTYALILYSDVFLEDSFVSNIKVDLTYSDNNYKPSILYEQGVAGSGEKHYKQICKIYVSKEGDYTLSITLPQRDNFFTVINPEILFKEGDLAVYSVVTYIVYLLIVIPILNIVIWKRDKFQFRNPTVLNNYQNMDYKLTNGGKNITKQNYCSFCGHNQDIDQNYCPNCGELLR